jgi:hypothetical protein
MTIYMCSFVGHREKFYIFFCVTALAPSSRDISVANIDSERVQFMLFDFVYHPSHPSFLYEDHNVFWSAVFLTSGGKDMKKLLPYVDLLS